MLSIGLVKEFLKPKRNKILVLLIFIAFIIVYIYIFVVRCGFGTMKGHYCYIRSEFDGRPCDSVEDCGKGSCILVDENKVIGKGVCRDIESGCKVHLYGNYPSAKLCED